MNIADIELQVAVVLKAHDWVARALAQGADPNRPMNDKGSTVVHYACWRGDARILRLLAAAGADLERRTTDRSAWTPLHMTIFHGRLEELETLIDLGVDVHQRVTRMPPLFWAAERGQDALIDPLLRAGAADSLTTGDVCFLRKARDQAQPFHCNILSFHI